VYSLPNRYRSIANGRSSRAVIYRFLLRFVCGRVEYVNGMQTRQVGLKRALLACVLYTLCYEAQRRVPVPIRGKLPRHGGKEVRVEAQPINGVIPTHTTG